MLDGRDTAMLRVAMVDPHTGALVDSATDRISWRIVRGPGRVSGTSNGDPASHEWLKSHDSNLFLGLGRAFVQVRDTRGRGEGGIADGSSRN